MTVTRLRRKSQESTELVIEVEPRSDIEAQFESMLSRLKQLPNAGHKMLELATALSNRGHREAAAHVELTALELYQPAVTHRWRLMQAKRASANQFLLLRNNLRTAAFQKALAERVSGGNLVLEIGTGSGILAMLAAQAGAGHVVTCEHQALMARTAQAIVRDNRLHDKITVLPKSSHELKVGTDLSRRADILVADLFTGSLLEAGGLKLIREARKHLLQPDGHVIPAAASIRGRLVGGSDLEKLCRAGNPANLNLSRFDLFSPPLIYLLPERFSTLEYDSYSEIINCFEFNFYTLDRLQARNCEIEIECTRSGEVTGFLQWLRLDLSPHSSMESDEHSSLNWTRCLHVFPQPVQVVRGQLLPLHLEHDWTSISIWPSKPYTGKD